jgi:hypothetical protein
MAITRELLSESSVPSKCKTPCLSSTKLRLVKSDNEKTQVLRAMTSFMKVKHNSTLTLGLSQQRVRRDQEVEPIISDVAVKIAAVGPSLALPVSE